MAEAVQFQVTKWQVGAVETNLDDVEKAVSAALEKYRGYVVTADGVSDAKETRAQMNNLSKNINSWRLEKEREFMAPFQPKKDQCNRIVKMIKAVSDEIDFQIKNFEQKEKDAKKAIIEAWWKENGNPQIPLDKVWDEKYLNKSTTTKAWQEDLKKKHERISADLASFGKIKDEAYPDVTDFLITKYLQIMDFGQTLAAWEEEKQARIRKKEVMEALEQEKADKAAQTAQNVEHEEMSKPAEVEPTVRENKPKETIYWAHVRLEGTSEQMVKLTEAINQIGITIKVLEKGHN